MRKIGYLTTVITIIIVFELPAFAQQEQYKKINYWKKLCFFQYNNYENKVAFQPQTSK